MRLEKRGHDRNLRTLPSNAPDILRYICIFVREKEPVFISRFVCRYDLFLVIWVEIRAN